MDSSQIIKEFTSKSKEEQVQILWGALGLMQSFNGRSKIDCIAITMGFFPDGSGEYEDAT